MCKHFALEISKSRLATESLFSIILIFIIATIALSHHLIFYLIEVTVVIVIVIIIMTIAVVCV